MTRLALGAVIGIAVGLVVGAALSIHAASTEPDSETVAAAAEAGVDAIDLLGAEHTTGLGPREYLYAVGELTIPGAVSPAAAVVTGGRAPTPPGRLSRVRLTYYVEDGFTYSGGRPYLGSTACSWNFAIGTRFRLPDGQVVTCNDRGLLGSSGWLDLWRQPSLVKRYGPYVDVEVLP